MTIILDRFQVHCMKISIQLRIFITGIIKKNVVFFLTQHQNKMFMKARERTEFMHLALGRVLPIELGKFILEFILPVTHADWRLGASFSSYLFFDGLNDEYYQGPFPKAMAARFNEAYFHTVLEESVDAFDLEDLDYDESEFENMLGGFDLH